MGIRRTLEIRSVVTDSTLASPVSRTLSHVHPIETPAEGRTGRLMGAHFPDVAVSASSTALTTGTRQMMPNDKVAVIYGAGGAIGGAVAQAFARERAKVFLTGRNLAPVEVVAQDIVSARGTAEAAEVDALDEQAVDRHLQAGRVDISFNAVGIPDTKILGVPMVDLGVEQFSRPIATYTTTYFLTARLAAEAHDPERSCQVGAPNHNRLYPRLSATTASCGRQAQLDNTRGGTVSQLSATARLCASGSSSGGRSHVWRRQPEEAVSAGTGSSGSRSHRSRDSTCQCLGECVEVVAHE